MSFILAIILLILAVCGIVVRKTYYYLPVRELKRQAAKHDPLAQRLYRAVAYDGSLQGFLWAFIVLTSAGGFVLLSRSAPIWLSLLAVAGLLLLAFSWLPATRTTKFGAQLTVWVTPVIVWLLDHFYPPLQFLHRTATKRHVPKHTGIFEKEDLLKLIDKQRDQEDSRLNDEELEIIKRALDFSDKRVGSLLTKRKKLKSVMANDTIGPILIDEVHKSGQKFVVVRESKKGPVVGTLDYERLNLESQGKVSDLMDSTVYFIHERDSLSEALHAFFVTNHSTFIVVNNFEEFVGIIAVKDILRQLLGHIPGDEFDQYADMSAVADRYTKPVQTDEEMVEYSSDENSKQ